MAKKKTTTEKVEEVKIERPNYDKKWAMHKTAHRVRYNDNKLKVNQAMEGQTMEQKIERMLANGETPEGGTEMIYTERKEGIVPAYDIRTDRFDVALDAMTKSSASERAKRQERHNPKQEEKEGDEKLESIHTKEAE